MSTGRAGDGLLFAKIGDKKISGSQSAGYRIKSGKTKRATLQKRRVSKSTKTTRTRKTVSPVLSCMTRAHRFLFV
ncbi:hypothetical protein LI160_13295 [Bacteroides xylanisolvens]|nr:hypothetical protein [Bacteroides xylanisolvens]